MKRVIVGGISGAGKTTLARRIAAILELPFHEVDALFHGPNWSVREEFVDDVHAATAEEAWVLDSYGYSIVRERLWSRADTMVWLDYPRYRIMPRVVRRSVKRAVGRETLWNGNVDSFKSWVQDTHPIRWAWAQHGPRRKLVEDLLEGDTYKHLSVVRLRTPREAEKWIAELERRK